MIRALAHVESWIFDLDNGFSPAASDRADPSFIDYSAPDRGVWPAEILEEELA